MIDLRPGQLWLYDNGYRDDRGDVTVDIILRCSEGCVELYQQFILIGSFPNQYACKKYIRFASDLMHRWIEDGKYSLLEDV